MFKKIIFVIIAGCMAILLTGCNSSAHDTNVLKVGTISGPETQLMEVAKQVAQNCYGLDVQIVTFSDYNMPNIALNDGSIDANVFQHAPYLQAQIKARDYKLAVAGKTYVYPMGVYSKTLKNLKALKDGAKVAIPNDPSNQARALLLLQDAGLITLTPGKEILSTLADIKSNPKKLQFVALAAAQLPRSLQDVSLAVINTNYAIPAGLLPTDALYAEGPASLYANVVAVRSADVDSVKVRELVDALHSKQVFAAAKRIFGLAALPAWNTDAPLLPCRAPQ